MALDVASNIFLGIEWQWLPVFIIWGLVAGGSLRVIRDKASPLVASLSFVYFLIFTMGLGKIWHSGIFAFVSLIAVPMFLGLGESNPALGSRINHFLYKMAMPFAWFASLSTMILGMVLVSRDKGDTVAIVIWSGVIFLATLALLIIFHWYGIIPVLLALLLSMATVNDMVGSRWAVLCPFAAVAFAVMVVERTRARHEDVQE